MLEVHQHLMLAQPPEVDPSLIPSHQQHKHAVDWIGESHFPKTNIAKDI